MDESTSGMKLPKKGFWGLLVLLIALNLALMSVDTVVMPAQGVKEAAPLHPPARSEMRAPRRPPPFDQFIRRFGLRPIDTDRPQPGIRPFPPGEPRPTRPPATPPSSLRPFSLHQDGWGGIALHIVGLLALLSTSVVLTYFLPERFRLMRDTLRGSWPHGLRTFAIGMVGYLSALLLAFLLAVVVSGFLYAVLVLAVLAVVTAVGVTAVSLAVGRWLSSIAGTGTSPLAQLLLGVLLIFPFTILPYIGWAAAAVAASFGMGAILLTKGGSGNPWSLEALQDQLR